MNMCMNITFRVNYFTRLTYISNSTLCETVFIRYHKSGIHVFTGDTVKDSPLFPGNLVHNFRN